MGTQRTVAHGANAEAASSAAAPYLGVEQQRAAAAAYDLALVLRDWGGKPNEHRVPTTKSVLLRPNTGEVPPAKQRVQRRTYQPLCRAGTKRARLVKLEAQALLGGGPLLRSLNEMELLANKPCLEPLVCNSSQPLAGWTGQAAALKEAWRGVPLSARLRGEATHPRASPGRTTQA